MYIHNVHSSFAGAWERDYMPGYLILVLNHQQAYSTVAWYQYAHIHKYSNSYKETRIIVITSAYVYGTQEESRGNQGKNGGP